MCHRTCLWSLQMSQGDPEDSLATHNMQPGSAWQNRGRIGPAHNKRSRNAKVEDCLATFCCTSPSSITRTSPHWTPNGKGRDADQNDHFKHQQDITPLDTRPKKEELWTRMTAWGGPAVDWTLNSKNYLTNSPALSTVLGRSCAVFAVSAWEDIVRNIKNASSLHSEHIWTSRPNCYDWSRTYIR